MIHLVHTGTQPKVTLLNLWDRGDHSSLASRSYRARKGEGKRDKLKEEGDKKQGKHRRERKTGEHKGTGTGASWCMAMLHYK